jgi:putative ABC transport system permease protein
MQTLWQDLRYGARMLLKQPGFTLIVVFTVALGIGANGVIFSVVNAVLLRPLPYERAEELVAVSVRTSSDPREYVSWPDWQDWRAQRQSFAQLTAYVPQSVNLTGRTGSQIEPNRLIGGFVSVDFLSILGVAAAQGRAFLPGEDVTGAERVAVVSHELWRDRFGADPQLIGQTLTLNNQLFTVVGVMPAGFRAPYSAVEVWLPIQHYPNFSLDRKQTSAGVFGRLKPGVSLRQAQTEMNTIAARLAAQYPETNKDRGINVVELQTRVVEQLKPALLVLFGAVGFVLLIACANVTNLFLGRMVGRERELALRAVLGASRMRLLRQLLTESLLLSLGADACLTL